MSHSHPSRTDEAYHKIHNRYPSYGRSNDRTMGTDFGSYGMPRQFIMGVNVTF